ncbi:S-layer homology domain-containing protein [Alkaliphilus serpentinus]|nr:S-layer homology domain-containing protein [Alkaliphilus serpentinus]
MKKSRVLILILAVILSVQFTFAITIYKDTENHWSNDYIRWATNEVKILSGFEDGTFRPNNVMTRIEYVTALNDLIDNQGLMNIFDLETDEATIAYKDISADDWQYDEIQQLESYILNNKNNSISIKDILGEEDFQPEKAINRYEALLLSTAISLPPVDEIVNTFTDLDMNTPNYTYILEGIGNGFLKGYSDNTIRLEKELTRAEAATLLMRVGKELEQVNISYLTYAKFEPQAFARNLPQFQKPSEEDSNQLELHDRFIKAIASLQYIEFVGHIPYSERHLYDEKPLVTLWQLKNESYLNLIGNNYYIIKHDKSLDNEEILGLVNEGITHLFQHTTVEIEGLNKFLSIAMEVLPLDEAINRIEGYFEKVGNDHMKLSTGILLIDYYHANEDHEKLINIYRAMVNNSEGLTEELQANIIQNYIYLIYEVVGKDEALKESQNIYDRLVNENASNKMHLDFVMKGLIKELMQL